MRSKAASSQLYSIHGKIKMCNEKNLNKRVAQLTHKTARCMQHYVFFWTIGQKDTVFDASKRVFEPPFETSQVTNGLVAYAVLDQLL